MTFNIFVSYSTHDLWQVQALQKQIENTPIKIFVAESSVSPSQELAPSISKAIKECDLFIVLWSKNAKDSDWVAQEIGKATAYKKKILPLILEEGLSLPGFISGLKYLPIFQNSEQELQKAKQFIESEYNSKKNIATQKQKDKEGVIIGMGIGALLLWAINQK